VKEISRNANWLWVD